MKNIVEGISVLMPVYNQQAFVRHAYLSLQKQTFKNWQLIIINDGSTDSLEEVIGDIIKHPGIIYLKNEKNEGLGYSLNKGLKFAKYDYIAYLPADDYFYEDHLETLKDELESEADVVLAFSGVRYFFSDSFGFAFDTENTLGRKGHSIQLVQVCHKKTDDLWLERKEFVTEDLFLMYWSKLIGKGKFRNTFKITSFWTQHINQRHTLICENFGGNINKYRSYYKIKHPLRLRVDKNKYVDEEERYVAFRKECAVTENSLKIVLMGELSYNPERVYALEEHGHRLYGLWTKSPVYSFHYVGKLPFGHIEDISTEGDWIDTFREINPDIIYGISNLHSIDFVYDTLMQLRNNNVNTPFVWHFKEGPLAAIKQGYWDKLFQLYYLSDGNIYLNETLKSWFDQFLPLKEHNFILDLDLAKKDYFTDKYSDKLSQNTDAVHTFVAGRLIGINEDEIRKLADNNIHLHIYSEHYHSGNDPLQFYSSIAPRHIHFHPHCSINKWVEEFSQYDAGWLHIFSSRNNGDLQNVNWDDLNLPNRLSLYAAAGTPMILKNNAGHLVAVEELLRDFDIGVFFNDIEDLSMQLREKKRMKQLADNLLLYREKFTFDYYVPSLIAYFHKIIEHKKSDNPNN